MRQDEQDARLHAMTSNRAKGESIASIVAEVLRVGLDAAWEPRHPADLLGTGDDQSLLSARRELSSWRQDGYQFVSILNSDYPRRLRSVHDAPPFLFYRGDLTTLRSVGVSVVGSREVSPEGVRRAMDLATHLAERGITVISGLARGVDAAAHTAALAAGGRTVGVIATGIAGPYTPTTSRALHEQVAAHGALVSQFSPTAPAMKHTFLKRNATMSGLGFATVVIEAGEHSGARAQARLAMEHGRPVILTDHVVQSTKWGRELADGSRANVYVVSTREDVHAVISRVTSMTPLESLDSMLAASR